MKHLCGENNSMNTKWAVVISCYMTKVKIPVAE